MEKEELNDSGQLLPTPVVPWTVENAPPPPGEGSIVSPRDEAQEARLKRLAESMTPESLQRAQERRRRKIQERRAGLRRRGVQPGATGVRQ